MPPYSMSNRPNVPHIDKEALRTLLLQRFQDGFKKLSDIPDPSLLLNGERAAKRLAHAIQSQERIALVGDYDVDGVTSSAIVSLFFKSIGYPLRIHIPNRFRDGYGISAALLQRIDADLILTVDNGINAIEAATLCKEREIDLIITDHHTPSDTLPDAYAIVNPKLPQCPYPFKEICGAQVAWLLMGLLKRELGVDVNMGEYLDLLALAIIADVMPLTHINRAMVQAGLQQMQRSSRPASIVISEFLNKSSISAEDIAFQIAPRLNSAGRLDDASTALHFLTATTPQEAYDIFETLSALNVQRKHTEANMTEEALLHVNNGDHIIVVAAEGWNEGVVGIVAARLVQRFSKPAIVLSIVDGMAKGSARSLGNIDIYALIQTQISLLEKFGGHKMAAGLSLRVENIALFKKELNRKAAILDPSDFLESEAIVGELSGDSIDFELLDILDAFEPYGEANPRPKFLVNGAKVRHISYFGADKDHSRLQLYFHDNTKILHHMIAFRQKISLPADQQLTCSYTINRNEYGEKVSIQMILERIY